MIPIRYNRSITTLRKNFQSYKMGRTIYKHREDDEERSRRGHKSKHSKNLSGEGMRVINKWSEEDYYKYDDSDDLDYEYNANTMQIQRKRK